MFIEGGGLLPEIKLGERQLAQNNFFFSPNFKE